MGIVATHDFVGYFSVRRSWPLGYITQKGNDDKRVSLKALLVRNFGFWIAGAVAYPIAHWIPTASGQPPRIFDILVPVFVLGLGLASNAVLGAGLRDGGRDQVADAKPGFAADSAP